MGTISHYKIYGNKQDSCPVCGIADPVLWEVAGVYWVQCDHCHASTTMDEDREVVVAHWNTGKVTHSNLRPMAPK